MSFANLPHPIATFLQAAQKRDTAALLTTFADDAVLVDRGVEHRRHAIKEWNDRFFLRGDATVHPINVARGKGRTALMVTGREDEIRTRTPVQLDWRFTILEEKISALTISPAEPPGLPVPVAAYILAMNTFDLDRLVNTFADDAVVNDELLEHWGKAAIRNWAAPDIVSNRVTMYVVSTVERHGHVIVTANVDGDCDKMRPARPARARVLFFDSPGQDHSTDHR